MVPKCIQNGAKGANTDPKWSPKASKVHVKSLQKSMQKSIRKNFEKICQNQCRSGPVGIEKTRKNTCKSLQINTNHQPRKSTGKNLKVTAPDLKTLYFCRKNVFRWYGGRRKHCNSAGKLHFWGGVPETRS